LVDEGVGGGVVLFQTVDGGVGSGVVLFQTVDGGSLAAVALIRTQILDFVAIAGEPFSRW
jgi:hypothetical protein